MNNSVWSEVRDKVSSIMLGQFIRPSSKSGRSSKSDKIPLSISQGSSLRDEKLPKTTAPSELPRSHKASEEASVMPDEGQG